MATEYNQTDAMVTDRDRIARLIVALASLAFIPIISWFLGTGLTSFFRLPEIIGTSLGLGLGALGVMLIIPRLYVINDAVAAFVTVDLLSKELVTYGPGFHLAFPWEGRSGANNVNLEEASESYSVEVVLKDGSIKVPFSARLRPNIRALPNFLSGVASVASDLGDIISAQIVYFFTHPEDEKEVGVKEAIGMVAKLNEFLKEKFVEGESEEFEGRFGVHVGDITAGTILVTDEIKETLGALTESRLIDQAVAESYGRENIAAVEAAIKAGELDREDVNRRRTQAMAMSGNLQGMDLKETTTNFRIQGLDKVDPKLAEAIAGLAPALNALFAARKQQEAATGGGNQTRRR